MIGDLSAVMPAIGSALGISKYESRIELPPTEKAVVMVVDGLGYDLLLEHYELAPYLCSLVADPLLVGVPSTTATSLTSLATGVPPGQHGLVGYTMRVPETGSRLNALSWDQQVDPESWQPYRPVLSEVNDFGVHSVGINLSKFAGSGLTQCISNGVRFVGADTPWERTEAALAFLDSTDRGVAYTYEPWLDNAGHGAGTDSKKWRETLRAIDSDLRAFRAQLSNDTLLVITADHGMVDVPEKDHFDIDAVPELRENVTLIAGEARFRHIYTRPNTAEQVKAVWQETLGEMATVLTRGEAIALNWFGDVRDEVLDRIGDVLAAANDTYALFSSVDFPREKSMVGFHGSITDTERRIPFLVDG